MKPRITAILQVIVGLGLMVTGSISIFRGRHTMGIGWVFCGIGFLAIGVWGFLKIKKSNELGSK